MQELGSNGTLQGRFHDGLTVRLKKFVESLGGSHTNCEKVLRFGMLRVSALSTPERIADV